MSGMWKMLVLLGGIALGVAFIRAAQSTEATQGGFNGVGMEQVVFKTDRAGQLVSNSVPAAFPPAGDSGARAGEAYENVQVLGHLSTAQFTRLMTAITTWVAPQQGCNYCHNPANLASDDIYQKVVSRRMIQMTMHVNSNWSPHVKGTGVTCYTCHRGQPVPANIWFAEEPDRNAQGMIGSLAGQNLAAKSVTYASLPSDPFTPFLQEGRNIRVVSTEALPNGNRSSIKQAEWTYGLMVHMTSALGVNCTHCHNSRAWADWSQSPPTRAVAWHGIRMVRDLNQNFLIPLGPEYPPNRLGPTGDAPKANCATCHHGAPKPLLGAQMLKDYPSLTKAVEYKRKPKHAFAFATDGRGKATLKGKVPSEDTRTAIVQTAQTSFEEVSDELTVTGKSGTAEFEAAYQRALAVLPMLSSGSIAFDEGELGVRGVIPAAQQEAARQALEAPGGPTMGPMVLLEKEVVDSCESDFASQLAKTKIRFASGSAEIAAESRALLQRLATIAERCPGRFSVEGHTDNVGRAESNQELSQKRAAAVASALEGLGIAADRLEPVGFGQERPIGNNKTSSGRAQNRRIEIRIKP